MAQSGCLVPATDEGPSTNAVSVLLTDMYQITMAYAYWKADKHEEFATFDAFTRKNPFKGEYTVFAGLEETLRHVQTFRFSESDIEYLKTQLPQAEAEFWEYLSGLDCSSVRISAMAEGTVFFPRVPVLRVEGPVIVCQLLETTILNLCNFASLMATNACRFRKAAGADKELLEFGLRRAQGPDGAMSATRYSVMGGFDATSNVAGGKAFAIPIRGTHAHSFVSSFTSVEDLKGRHNIGDADALVRSKEILAALGFDCTSESELAAFIAYAQAFPDSFLALVDTYDTLHSGIPNFIAVATVLREQGHRPGGIRLDSGDLAYLSKAARRMFQAADEQLGGGSDLASCKIVASNSINETVLHSLNDQKHEIDVFGIGTNLVTCQSQPALGMVFKLVEIDGKPCIKLSQEITKVTLPGRKLAYRLLSKESEPILDLVVREDEAAPAPGRRVLCHHPFEDKKRVYVTPTTVQPLLSTVWVGKNVKLSAEDAAALGRCVAADEAAAEAGEAGAAAGGGGGGGAAAGGAPLPLEARSHSLRVRFPPLSALRAYVEQQMRLVREDHLRPLNPTPYKVSLSADLFHFLHRMWGEATPIPELA